MLNINAIFYFFQINSGLDYEIVKSGFLISLVISLIVYHKYHNAPVGIIAPGVIMLSVGYPEKIAGILVISLLVYLSAMILHKYVFSHIILAQREKMLILVLLSVIFSFIVWLISRHFNYIIEGGLGIVVPAMLASSLTKNYKKEQVKSLFIATFYSIIAYAALKWSANKFLPVDYKYYVDTLYLQRYIPNYELDIVMFLLFAVAVIYNLILYRIAKLTSVGMLLGAYLGLFIFQPAQLVFVIIVTVLSYLITSIIYKHTMIYGFRVFVVSASIVTFIYSVAERLFFYLTGQTFQPFFGIYVAGGIAGTLICTLLVSEALQQGYKKTLGVTALMTVILSATLLLAQTISPKIGINQTIAGILEKSEARAYYKKPSQREKPQPVMPESFKEQAVAGDSLSTLARRATVSFDKVSKLKLKNYQKLYIETKLAARGKGKILYVGDTISFSYADMSKLAEESKHLDPGVVRLLKRYKVNYEK